MMVADPTKEWKYKDFLTAVYHGLASSLVLSKDIEEKIQSLQDLTACDIEKVIKLLPTFESISSTIHPAAVIKDAVLLGFP